ncbi:hypothetical protein CYMTET_20849 [Cymbomonas tetramitiformis]|uniref:Kinesin motor domain-containing protein n=1 Tax=Cymbomonas tetramitiformis TaxID=36881 RepID=A0AAE0G382_9CHLO|nr:hypothetical protein CYMTET_20849 [Cymbomonas tetramitiformis]
MPPRVGSARSKAGKVLKSSFPPPRPAYDSSSAASEVPGFLQVAVRCRPLISNEVKRGQSCERLLVDDETNKVVVLPEPGSTGEWKEFRFDYVYTSATKQEKMFTDLGQPAVEKAFAWYNSKCRAPSTLDPCKAAQAGPPRPHLL